MVIKKFISSKIKKKKKKKQLTDAGIDKAQIDRIEQDNIEVKSYDLKDNKLFVHRILTINKGLYPKEKYSEYIAFRKKTASNDNTKVLISKL